MRRGSEGFSYLGLMLAIAVSSAALAAGAEVWHTALKREKERELLFVGDQFRQAIGLYYRATPGPVKKYPHSIEDLLKDPRQPGVQRYLRRIYRDPLSGKAEWGLIASPEGGIMGVHSLLDETPLKTGNFTEADRSFEGKTQYSQWMFVYQPKPAGNAAQKNKAPSAG